MYTHLCRSKNLAGLTVSTRHHSEGDAIIEQKRRIASSAHSNVVVMPVPREELADYPTPTVSAMTKAKQMNRCRNKCQSKNHRRHYGPTWQCAGCQRTYCCAEGMDDATPDLCDDCWFEQSVAKERLTRVVVAVPA